MPTVFITNSCYRTVARLAIRKSVVSRTTGTTSSSNYIGFAFALSAKCLAFEVQRSITIAETSQSTTIVIGSY